MKKEANTDDNRIRIKDTALQAEFPADIVDRVDPFPAQLREAIEVQ